MSSLPSVGRARVVRIALRRRVAHLVRDAFLAAEDIIVVGTDTYPSITAYRGRKIRAVIPLVAIKKVTVQGVRTVGISRPSTPYSSPIPIADVPCRKLIIHDLSIDLMATRPKSAERLRKKNLARAVPTRGGKAREKNGCPRSRPLTRLTRRRRKLRRGRRLGRRRGRRRRLGRRRERRRRHLGRFKVYIKAQVTPGSQIQNSGFRVVARRGESQPSTEYGRQDDWNLAHTRPSLRTPASTAAGGRRTARAAPSPRSMARGSRKRWATPWTSASSGSSRS